MDYKLEADRLLRTIAQFSEQQALDQAEYDAELERLKEKYSIIGSRAQSIKTHELMLQRFMKLNKDQFFPEGVDQVTLQYGTLLYGHGEHVIIPRDAVENCEREGFSDAVKIQKSIDRAVVEGWEDVKLTAIGARRVPTEKFEYELKKEKAAVQAA